MIERRDFVLGSAAALALACAAPQKNKSATSPSVEFDDVVSGSGRDTVLVALPHVRSTSEAWTGLAGELSQDFDVRSVKVTSGVRTGELRAAIQEHRPRCLVLMGDEAVRVLEKVQRDGVATPPSVLMMTSFAESAVTRVHGGIAISYEVPGLTSFVKMRQLSRKPVRRVGVLVRRELAGYVSAQAKLAKMERVEIVPSVIDGEPAPRKVRAALRSLMNHGNVDAVWVLNDSALVSPENLRGAWLPEAHERPIPIIVGVASLVNADLSFGSIAVVPDHEALGVQAANLVFELGDLDFVAPPPRVEMPLSVLTIVDMTQAERLALVDDAATKIDRAVY